MLLLRITCIMPFLLYTGYRHTNIVFTKQIIKNEETET